MNWMNLIEFVEFSSIQNILPAKIYIGWHISS